MVAICSTEHAQAGQNGAVYEGWVLLGKYSTKAQMAVSYLLKAIVDGKTKPVYWPQRNGWWQGVTERPFVAK